MAAIYRGVSIITPVTATLLKATSRKSQPLPSPPPPPTAPPPTGEGHSLIESSPALSRSTSESGPAPAGAVQMVTFEPSLPHPQAMEKGCTGCLFRCGHRCCRRGTTTNGLKFKLLTFLILGGILTALYFAREAVPSLVTMPALQQVLKSSKASQNMCSQTASFWFS